MQFKSYWHDTAEHFAGIASGPVEGSYDVAVVAGMMKTLIEGRIPHMLIEFGPLDAQGTGKGKATIYGRLYVVRGATRPGNYDVVVDLGWVGDYADTAVCAAGTGGALARRTVKPVTTKVVATAKK